MAIQETIVVELAEVAVNDDYRVELTQLRKVIDYSPQQARDLANELVLQADRAEAALAEDTKLTLAELDERIERAVHTQPRTVTGSVIL